MPPPLAKAIGLEIKSCVLAKLREDTAGRLWGQRSLHLARGALGTGGSARLKQEMRGGLRGLGLAFLLD